MVEERRSSGGCCPRPLASTAPAAAVAASGAVDTGAAPRGKRDDDMVQYVTNVTWQMPSRLISQANAAGGWGLAVIGNISA